VRFGKLCREKYFHGEMVSGNGYLFCKTIITNRISDGENQVKPSRELRIGERDGRLYSKIAEESGGEKLMGPRPIYYGCPVETTNQKLKSYRRGKRGN
jgi:hypothetical protein